MLIKGLDAQPIHEMVMRLLLDHGVVYLHKSAPPGDGWIVSNRKDPEDPFSPETITIRRGERIVYSQGQAESPGVRPTPYVPPTDAEIAEIRDTARRLDALHGPVHRLLDEVEASRNRSVTAIEYMREFLRKAGGDLEFTPDGPRLVVPELDRARALLKRIEWSGEGEAGDEAGRCPECHGQAHLHISQPKSLGHNPGCELAALIGADT
jgi:hypothetical protein